MLYCNKDLPLVSQPQAAAHFFNDQLNAAQLNSRVFYYVSSDIIPQVGTEKRHCPVAEKATIYLRVYRSEFTNVLFFVFQRKGSTDISVDGTGQTSV